MKRIAKIFSVSSVALVMAGCLLTGCGAGKPQTMTLSLDSNPTTGYSWTVTQDPELFTVTEEFVEGENSEGFVGVGGQQVFTLTPDNAGTSAVTFTYSRPWEDPEQEITVIAYTVDVSSSKQIQVTSAKMEAGGDAGDLPEVPSPVIK